MSPPTVTSSPEPKRRRRGRVRFTDHQVESLERRFREEQYLPASERSQLAASMDLSESQVKTWFQNRRAKTKRAIKRMRKARAAQAAMSAAARQVPNVNVGAASWMSPSQAAAMTGGAPAQYSLQPMQFGVDALASPPVTVGAPMEAYVYRNPTENSSAVAYPAQQALPSANPHAPFVVGGIAVTADSGHRHLSSPFYSAHHASASQVLPQYGDYVPVPLTTRHQRTIVTADPAIASGSSSPLVRSNYSMPYVQLGDQAQYTHRHL